MEEAVGKPAREVLLLGNSNSGLLNMVAHMIQKDGVRVTTAASGKAAHEALRSRDFDAVVTDLDCLLVGGNVFRETEVRQGD